MSIWKEVRQLARKKHSGLTANPDLIPAADLIKLATEATGIGIIVRPPDDVLLDGAEAAYDRESLKIFYSQATEESLANFHIAHEFGHHWLDEVGAACSADDLNTQVSSEPELSSVGDQDSYSPKERTEAQANLFAREFLLPREKIRNVCSGGSCNADSVAKYTGVPVDLVMQQMVDALLLPAERERAAVEAIRTTPDASQQEAIEASDGPWQVLAGPGTGKTTTLVGRVAHLVGSGLDPNLILALTYSNLSAQDLASRLRNEIGERAIAVWSGTFHAYGLEILRKHGHLLGIESEPTPMDRTDSLMLLEELLPSLELNYYLELHEPILKLRSILGAIGRAKDELASPDKYMECAQTMRRMAADPKAIETAERAIEVARVYRIYESTLRERGLVDFGDLLALPVQLMRSNKEMRQTVRRERPRVLVDEYQDMNRASGLFLKEICTPGLGPWVVGDARQSIYRFRGASPLNMTRFADEFPGAQQTNLAVNYRSYSPIVKLFGSFGHTMVTGNGSADKALSADRGDADEVIQYNVASTREAEAAGIIESIRSKVEAGKSYGDHVILARSHTILTRIAKQFDVAGVPCLYFGSFFERPEVSDLLCVLSLVGERPGFGILRVAQFPIYAVPPSDIAVLIDWRKQQDVSMLEAVKLASSINGLTDNGRDGLCRLASDLADVHWKMSPHQLLMYYLFRRSDYLSEFIADESVVGQQRRLAIYQLLQFAFAFRSPGKTNPKSAFLAHVRRLEVLDEEKQLRQLPAAASEIDAVRLMTVHAAKGLEFPIVHVVGLTTRQFPAPNRPNWCPLPDGLIESEPALGKDAEEDSLFFVAVSRAMNTLNLSRSVTNGKQNCNASRFLGPVKQHLPKSVSGPPNWTVGNEDEEIHPQLAGQRENATWTAKDIETYSDCPRRYYYQRVIKLGDYETTSAYLKFQSAIHSSMAWLRDTPSLDERRRGLDERFAADWAKFGPIDDPLAVVYQEKARDMIYAAMKTMNGEILSARRQVTLPRTGVTVDVRADQVQRAGEGIVIRRLKAGRLAKSETSKVRYALLYEAVRRDHAGERVTFEHLSLLTDERRRVDLTATAKTIAECDNIVSAASDGQFEPRPNQYCSTCPYFFVCPSHGETR